MLERYIAFDVETPNASNARMNAIGIAVVENGRIVDEFSTLVNPESHFDTFNIQLTGITPGMAAEAPTFQELWPTIEPILSSGLLVAHNAPFDMSVLSKCLRAYRIVWKRCVDYACTCRMGRRCYPQLPNHAPTWASSWSTIRPGATAALAQSCYAIIWNRDWTLRTSAGIMI